MEVLLPLPASRRLTGIGQSRRGAWALTVVVKATYDSLPCRSSRRSRASRSIRTRTTTTGTTTRLRSLYSPSDLLRSSRAPTSCSSGTPSRRGRSRFDRSTVRLIVGDVNKAIEVFGERAWTHDGLLREGPRFIKMPLRYERASGGGKTSNPVGMRADNRPDTFGNIQVPNLQPPGVLLADASNFIESDRLRATRAELARPSRQARPPRRDVAARRLEPAGAGRHRHRLLHGGAARSQQVEVLRPNERIILENLHPASPAARDEPPGDRAAGVRHRRGAAQHELSLTCDTL